MGKTIILSRLYEFSFLFKCILENEFDVDIDAEKYAFFNPKEILMLTEFFVVQNYNGFDGALSIHPDKGWYFDGIELANFCNTNYKAPKTRKQSISTAIPIMRINITTMNEYIENALKFFSVFCRGKDITVLSVCIAEIINNVNDHSQSNHDAYIFSQHYPKSNEIKFAIADLGIGIPTTVNKYLVKTGQEALNNKDALKWATEKGKTSKSKQYNKGFGLDNIISFVRGVGSLEIYTEDVYCSLDKSGNLYFRENPINGFIGTLIEINIKINKLEDEDETIIEDFLF